MTIETKCNIGDEVWFRCPSGQIVCDKITVVWMIRVMPHEQEVWYQLKRYTHRKESQLFPTKTELIKKFVAMEFNSQICTTKEQSERLLALGLKKGTADMCLNPSRKLVYPFSYSEALTLYDNCGLGKIMETDLLLPAWSLHRLIEMIPNKIACPTIYDSAPLRISENSMYYLHRFFDKYGDENFSTVGDDDAIGSHNVYDYAVSVIGFIIKEGHFNKEYLEE